MGSLSDNSRKCDRAEQPYAVEAVPATVIGLRDSHLDVPGNSTKIANHLELWTVTFMADGNSTLAAIHAKSTCYLKQAAMNRSYIDVRVPACRLAFAGAWVWLSLILISCDPDTKHEIETVMSPAAGVVSDHSGSPDTSLVDEQPDYGFRVKFTLKNVGRKGLISVTIRLSTSEGEWTRSQKLLFSEGEAMVLT